MTKNTKLYLIGLVLITAISTTTVIGVGMLISPRQPTKNSISKNISAADNGTTVTIRTGDSLRLSLKDYGDGGYSWSITGRNAAQLALASNDHINGSGGLGDFGSDLWVFTALQPGTSSLELVCARSWNQSDVCATFNINVVIQ